MNDVQTIKEKNTILQLYAILVISLILSFMPFAVLQAVSFIFLLAVVIGAPIYQWKAQEGSLLHNHMQYLNGTIWIGGLFLLICCLILGFWVFSQSDQSVFYAFFERLGTGAMVTEDELRAVFSDFMQANMALLIQASIICIGPPLAYMFYRIIKAVSRAVKMYRMPYPKSWL